MKPKDWGPLAIVTLCAFAVWEQIAKALYLALWLAIVAVCAFAVWLGAVGIPNSIDAEQDRAVEACKAPVRRTK